MKRYTITDSYDTGAKTFGRTVEEDPEGEWMRADEVLPRIAELEAESARMRDRLELTHKWVPDATMENFTRAVLTDEERARWPDAVTARDATIQVLEEEIAGLMARIDRLRQLALPFVAIHGDRWSRERGLPDWHMAAHFYDMVKELGGRVDGFVRVEMNAEAENSPTDGR